MEILYELRNNSTLQFIIIYVIVHALTLKYALYVSRKMIKKEKGFGKKYEPFSRKDEQNWHKLWTTPCIYFFYIVSVVDCLAKIYSSLLSLSPCLIGN